jgi:L-seryl-tRNA(Ser) seleniumtransferase
VILAGLAATLRLYRAGVAHTAIPIWRQISAGPAELEARAGGLLAAVASEGYLVRPGARFGVELAVGRVDSTIGGGSLPGETLPSWALVINGPPPQRLLAALRASDPAVIGRVVDDAVVLDVRTVEPSDDERLAVAVRQAILSMSGTASR